MEKINKFLRRSKTFNSYDSKANKRKDFLEQSDDVAARETAADFGMSRRQPPSQHLAKVSNPSDPQGTLKRFETENLQRPKIKQIIGLGKKQAHRNSFSSEDITIRKQTASPQPARQQRTKTMFGFDFMKSKTKKSALKPSSSTQAIADNFLRPVDNVSDNRKVTIDRETVYKTSVPKTHGKDSVNVMPLVKMRQELSSVEIDIDEAPSDKLRRRQDMRTYSRSLNDIVIQVPCNKSLASVKVLKEKFEDIPIMGRTSLISKAQMSISPSSKRRSSLPVDFKDLPSTHKDKRDKIMANQQQQVCLGSPSNVIKISQHDLVPKSPTTKLGESNPSEEYQIPHKTSTITNLKSIKNILQKFLNRRPSQQELVTKGIIQDQRIFGNSLRNLCRNLTVGRKVPEFVSAVICMIQEPYNVVSHGIYRASGNIATIQKIRFRVNEGNNLDILKEYRKDVDVLTGSLKLFFRELTEPLISTQMLQDLCELKDKELTDHDRLLSEADKIIKRQPDYHRDVLTELINHILYVNSFGEKNSMSVDSMSIVWGPSLIFTDNEDSGMLLQRITNNNSIIKFLLNIYNTDYVPSKVSFRLNHVDNF